MISTSSKFPRRPRGLLAAALLCLATAGVPAQVRPVLALEPAAALPVLPATSAIGLRAARDQALQQGLERVVRELGLDGALARRQLALALVDVSDAGAPRLAMLNGDEMMYAASLPKVGILVGALAEAESGRLRLDESRLQAMHNMIRRSSNEDASRVLDWVGGERLLQWLQSERFGLYDPREGGGLWVGKGYGAQPAFRRDPLRNLSHGATAYQVARLYTMLAAGTLLQPRFNALMMDILARPGIHHKFVRALADQPDARIYRKSGTWKDTHADSALVEQGSRRYVMVAIAEHRDGGDWLVQLGARMHRLVVGPDGTRAAAPTLAAANGRPLR